MSTMSSRARAQNHIVIGAALGAIDETLASAVRISSFNATLGMLTVADKR